MKSARLAEAISAAAAGAALGGAVGSRVERARPATGDRGRRQRRDLRMARHIRVDLPTGCGSVRARLDLGRARHDRRPRSQHGGHGAAQLRIQRRAQRAPEPARVRAGCNSGKGSRRRSATSSPGPATSAGRAEPSSSPTTRTCMHGRRGGSARRTPRCTPAGWRAERWRVLRCGRRSGATSGCRRSSSRAPTTSTRSSGGRTAATTIGRRVASSTAWGGSNRRCSRSLLARHRSHRLGPHRVRSAVEALGDLDHIAPDEIDGARRARIEPGVDPRVQQPEIVLERRQLRAIAIATNIVAVLAARDVPERRNCVRQRRCRCRWDRRCRASHRSACQA